MNCKIADKRVSIGLAALCYLLFVICPFSFAFGKKEETPPPLNPQWTLCITRFNVKNLPDSQKIIGDVVEQNLKRALIRLDTHLRAEKEYDYYSKLAWTKSMNDAAKALAAKRKERDLLVYQGSSRWKYRADLKTADAAIKDLDVAFNRAKDAVMKVEETPQFALSKDNLSNTFPTPPKDGKEYKFCTSNKLDAFVTARLTGFHGRILLRLRMYSLYSASYNYTDETLFSAEDTATVGQELGARLVADVSGRPPAALSITVNPKNADIQVRDSYAGKGKTGVIDYPPGHPVVSASAEGYESQSIKVPLKSGELSEVHFKLKPQTEVSFVVRSPDKKTTPVYQGAMYVGETPITLKAPKDQPQYVHTEDPRGKTAASVFWAGKAGKDITLLPGFNSKDPHPLETRRKGFYAAFGQFWFTLPMAFMLTGVAEMYSNEYIVNGNPNTQSEANNWRAGMITAWCVFGAVVIEGIIQLVRYTWTASKTIPGLIGKYERTSQDKMSMSQNETKKKQQGAPNE